MSHIYYDENAKFFAESAISADMSPIHKEFFSHLKDGSKILDAGCGPGRDIVAFIEKGYDVEAFDASIEMVRIATGLSGIGVVHATFDEYDTVIKYDGVWACASLLHVPRKDMIATLLHMKSLLAKDGVIYMSFKYGDEERQNNGRHFTDMNEDLLTSLLSEVGGIVPLKTWTTVDCRPNRSDSWINSIQKIVG